MHRRNHFKVRICIFHVNRFIFPSAAARQPPRLEADEIESIVKRPRKSLLAAFNGTDAAVPDAAAAAVPAIVELQERAAPSTAKAAAILAGLKRDSEHANAMHISNPGAPFGECDLFAAAGGGSGCAGGAPPGAPAAIASAAIAIAARCSASRLEAEETAGIWPDAAQPSSRRAVSQRRAAISPAARPSWRWAAGCHGGAGPPAPPQRRPELLRRSSRQASGQV